MAKNGKPTTGQLKPITKIMVEGFKAIRERKTLDIRPITVLCGANSSGKSSFLQPLLLMKQTLEHPYDPGPLLASGENVKFNHIREMLCRDGKPKAKSFSVGIANGDRQIEEVTYAEGPDNSIKIESSVMYCGDKLYEISFNKFPRISDLISNLNTVSKHFIGDINQWDTYIIRIKCFLEYHMIKKNRNPFGGSNIYFRRDNIDIINFVHLPGFRGNPERTYPSSAYSGNRFPGRFETYVPSILADPANETLRQQINAGMATLGLTTAVTAKRLNSNHIEVQVNRRLESSKSNPDMVSIADVGFGVSQTLPVVAALAVAVENQFVYIEQPEIHLHPNAQRAMATLIVEAANRGVRVVIETHSSILLRALQTLIAKGEMPHEEVILHWFQRNAKTGLTSVESVTPDECGRTGDWPVDFDDVILQGDADYLDAVEARRVKS